MPADIKRCEHCGTPWVERHDGFWSACGCCNAEPVPVHELNRNAKERASAAASIAEALAWFDANHPEIAANGLEPYRALCDASRALGVDPTTL